MTVGMDVRCPHCNKFFLAKTMEKHSKRCPDRVFYVWNKAGCAIPTHKDTSGKTLYVCIICGERDHSKPKIVTHLALHDFAHLQRFNLDAIMVHSPEFAVEQDELRCLTRKSCKFSAHSFYTEGLHRCEDTKCGNLGARLSTVSMSLAKENAADGAATTTGKSTSKTIMNWRYCSRDNRSASRPSTRTSGTTSPARSSR